MRSGEGSTIRNFIVYTDHPIRIVKLINFRRLRWAGNVARMKEGRCGKPKKYHNTEEMRGLNRPLG